MTYLEGVYWDLDGTIANTELEAHLPAFNNSLMSLVLIGIGILYIYKTSEDNRRTKNRISLLC